ncbi:hypothetical protein ACFX11_002616 [Malus domestica]
MASAPRLVKNDIEGIIKHKVLGELVQPKPLSSIRPERILVDSVTTPCISPAPPAASPRQLQYETLPVASLYFLQLCELPLQDQMYKHSCNQLFLRRQTLFLLSSSNLQL